MFKIYDLNFNPVDFPVDKLGYGMKALDITVGPVIYENIYTESSRADQLVKRYPKDRMVTINGMFDAYNKTDWRLKRDRVFEFLRSLGVFYVAESHQPFKLLKVIVDSDYDIERPVGIGGLFEIPLKIIDTPFKQSLHTTDDLDAEGIRWNNKWAYGMGLSGEKEQWRYSFSDENPRFYNAGTEAIKLIQQKESRIELIAQEEVPWVEIYDGETTFRLSRRLYPGGRLTIEGHQIRVNNANVLDQSNFEFLTVKKGWNEWEIRGISQFELNIDFRFLYD